MGKRASELKWDPVKRRYIIPGVEMEEEEAPPPPPPKPKETTKSESKPVSRFASNFGGDILGGDDGDDSYKPPAIDDLFSQSAAA